MRRYKRYLLGILGVVLLVSAFFAGVSSRYTEKEIGLTSYLTPSDVISVEAWGNAISNRRIEIMDATTKWKFPWEQRSPTRLIEGAIILGTPGVYYFESGIYNVDRLIILDSNISMQGYTNGMDIIPSDVSFSVFSGYHNATILRSTVYPCIEVTTGTNVTISSFYFPGDKQ